MLKSRTIIGLFAGLSAFAWAPEVFACDTPNSSTIYLSASFYPGAQYGTQQYPYGSVSLALGRMQSDPSITRLCVFHTGGAALDMSVAAATNVTVEGWTRWDARGSIGRKFSMFGGGQGQQVAISFANVPGKTLTVRNVDVDGAIYVQNANGLVVDGVVLAQDLGGSMITASELDSVTVKYSDLIGRDVSRGVDLTWLDSALLRQLDITLDGQQTDEAIFVSDANDLDLDTVSVHATSTAARYMLRTSLVSDVYVWNSEFVYDNLLPGDLGPAQPALSLDYFDHAALRRVAVDAPNVIGLATYAQGFAGALEVTESEFYSATMHGMWIGDSTSTIERTTIDMSNGVGNPVVGAWFDNGSAEVEDVFLVGPGIVLSDNDAAFRFDGSVDADISFTSAIGWRAFASLVALGGQALSGTLSSRGNLVQGSGAGSTAMYLSNSNSATSLALSSGENLLDSLGFAFDQGTGGSLGEGALSDANPDAELYGNAAFLAPGTAPDLDCPNSDATAAIDNLAWPYQVASGFFGVDYYVNPDYDFYTDVRGEFATIGAYECATISPYP